MPLSPPGAQIPVQVFRGDLLPLVFGVLSTTLGALGTVALLPRSRRHHHLLLYSSLVTLLYGLRVLAVTETVSYLAPASLLRWTDFTITGLILLPFTLFFVTLLSPQPPRVRRIIAVVLLAYTVAFDLAHLHAAWSARAGVINSTLVLCAMLWLVYRLFSSRVLPVPELWIVRAGMMAFVALVIYTNLVSLGSIPGNPRLEYIGFAALLACLGYVAARRALHHEHKLRVISNELDTAQRIQRGLLPDAAAVTCASIAARYEPVAWVAGDFYDILQSDDRGLGLLIADVAGHGVPAALTASMVKVAFRAQADNAADPAAVLAGINRALAGNVGVQFVTAAYLYLDFVTNEVRYCAAGHPPMLQWNPNSGAVLPVESNGLLLGAFSFAEYQNWTAPLVRGTRWLLYTDGAVEAANNQEEEIGPARLQACVLESSDARPAAICDAVVAQAIRWSNVTPDREQQDDITVLCVDYAA